MGKALMVLVTGFVLAGAVYSSSRSASMQDSLGQVSDHQYEILAREAALKGYEMAKQSIASSFSATEFQGAYGGGTFTTTISVNGTTASIASLGQMTGTDGEDVDYTVKAEYKQVSSVLPSDPPGFMDYALLAEEDLNLNGNILTQVLLTGEAAAELNANMHTNGDLHITGNSVRVQGFGTYVGSGHASPNKALLGSFEPNYNPTSEDGAHIAETIELPVFNMPDYLSSVTPTATNTGLVLAGDHTLGTRENPHIWYVDGNLTSTGGASIDGYVIFLVDGDINITGNMIAGNSGYDGNDESSMAFYASGEITLGGNVQIYGQMYANGNLTLHGTPRIYGTLVTAGEALLSGTPKIYYRSASPALTTIWQTRENGSELAAYSEW